MRFAQWLDLKPSLEIVTKGAFEKLVPMNYLQAIQNNLLVLLASAVALGALAFFAIDSAHWPSVGLAYIMISGVVVWQNAAQLPSNVTSSIDIEMVPEPSIIIYPDKMIANANALALRHFEGLEIGKPLASAFTGDLLNYVEKSFEEPIPRVVEFNERGQVERFFEVHLLPVFENGDESKPARLIAIFRDYTKHKRVEQMRVDFVANASHELRTPLFALSGFIETLKGPAKNDIAAQERFLDIMLGQTERMRRLIDDLLSLSRIEVNSHIRPETPIDLVELLQNAIDGLSNLARQHDVDLHLEHPPAPVLTRGDSDELYRLVENLVQNAIRYGSAGKKVDITLKRLTIEGGSAADLLLSVRDYGVGIAPEHLPRLTERFFRADKNDSRAKGGTGLGLAIVKHIVNRHRGRLEVESRVGEGTTFSVRLKASDTTF